MQATAFGAGNIKNLPPIQIICDNAKEEEEEELSELSDYGYLSSTYGDDRQNVIDKTLFDPYGDKGSYNGIILKSTGLPHGKGKMVYDEDKRVYKGGWRHGRWHRFGQAFFTNGDNYKGEYHFGQRYGNEMYRWKDGRVYDGMFCEDRRHGFGTFKWPDGAIYTGEFCNGQRKGHGEYKFSDGGKYKGEWKDGLYHGYGECTWEDGRLYKGDWKNGMAHGKGVETFADGTLRHDGQWLNDEPARCLPTTSLEDEQKLSENFAMLCLGVKAISDEDSDVLDQFGDIGIYNGAILKETGVPHGKGKMLYDEDKRVYEGEWRHGRWYSFGQVFFANGDSYKGEYRLDQRHGNGTCKWKDGRIYDGMFCEDMMHGRGTFKWPDGAMYTGEFHRGQREGHGEYKFSDGCKYKGEWKGGQYGECTWEDGRSYKGEWKNGVARGKGVEIFADGALRHDGQWYTPTRWPMAEQRTSAMTSNNIHRTG